MPFDQLFSGKVDTSAGGAAPATTSSGSGAGSTSTSAGQDSGGIASYVPPLVKNIGAGIEQGLVRDPISTFIPAGQWLERNIPGVRWLDERTNMTPEALQAANQQYQQQYGGSDAASVGRLGGNVLAGASIPGTGAVSALAGGGRIGAGLAGAYAGGVGSALTSGGYGENPLTAGIEGAIGGGALGSVLPGLGRAANTQLQGLADRLGIKLTGGQSQGGILQTVEDVSKRLPFSGATSTEASQKAQMVNVLERNMGIARPTGSLDLPEVGAARAAAGSDMERLANNITIDGSVPAGPPIAGRAATPDLMATLNNIVANHSTLGPAELDYRAAVHLRDAIQTSLNNNGGVMPGADFARLIANGGALDRFAGHSDSQVKNVAAAVRSALFNAADNTPNQPGIMDAFRDARLRYKASMTAADAIGPTGSTEQMTPQGLKQAINRHYADQLINPNATGPGYDMPDLSRLIRGIPKLASSGTAERLSLMNMLGIGIGAGGGVLGAMSGPIALSTAAHAALPYAAVAGAGALSRKLPWGQIGAAVSPLNPLLPRIAGEGVGRVITPNALLPSS